TMTIQKHDFIEVSYTAKTPEGLIFDTTDQKIAKEHGIDRPNKKYGPLTLCVGEYQVIQGLDESFIGRKIPDEYEIVVPAEKAFGKKRADKIRLVPLRKFKEQGMNPQPGMQVYIDNQMAVVKTVSGGRAFVDFNHPLASKDIMYSVKIEKKVEDTATQLSSLIELQFGSVAKTKIANDKATIEYPQEVPAEYAKILKTQILKIIPALKDIDFTVSRKEAPKKA
ncbi:MAG: FKBP-type peptidyl-prolyl cis-trans isomerase, partial [Candidatus Woesearchaeota archaeon]